MEQGILRRPDAELRYWSFGSGPAVLFAHGLGGNAMSWWQQVPHFERRWRCVTFSHRGFAPSTVANGLPDPADYAGDLVALADHLGLDRFAIVAQSMGGWGAVEFALQAPHRVRALVLAATSGTFDARAADPTAYSAWHVWAAAERERLDAAAIHPAAGEAMARERPDLAFLYASIDAMSPTLDKEALRQRLFAARVRPLADAARLVMPVLVACGEIDPVFASPVGPAFAAAFPRGRHIAFAKAGHSAYFEIAPEFNRHIEAFLAP
jgi:pimeloyl-ACP methyl ester carboxylesterase